MNDQQLERYARHILLPQMDVEGQQALLDAHVLVLGLGGLGCPVAQYLAAAGVGRLTLVDDDQVELSNLQRQVAHGTADIGRLKVESAADEVRRLNPDVEVVTHAVRADEALLTQWLGDVTLVVDCTDNASVRYALNRVALSLAKPWLSGAAVALSGQVTLFNPQQADSPCYRCLYPQLTEQQLSCAGSGVLSPLVGVVGATEALEAVKWLAGIGRSPVGKLMTYDALNSEWRHWQLPKVPTCPDCGSPVKID